MENPYSSSWDTPYNPVDDPYRVDRSTTFSPPPLKTNPRLEPVPESEANDLSLSDLLPEFFKEEAQAQPAQDGTFTYEFNPAEHKAVQQEEAVEPSLPPSENSHIYAWIAEQEQAERQEAEKAERKKLLIRIGAIAAVVGAVALFLIINVLTQPQTPVVTPSTAPIDSNLYPGATRVDAPAKLNDSLHRAFLEGQQPAPSSVEATYYLTADPATKGLEFYNRIMAARGYQKQVAIDQFLSLSPQTAGLNARGISYTNATQQGYAVVAIPVTAALATSLGGNAKAGDTLLALVDIKS
jgi:hypothetical protein